MDNITIPTTFIRRVARMRHLQMSADSRAAELERLVDQDLKVLAKLISDLKLAKSGKAPGRTGKSREDQAD